MKVGDQLSVSMSGYEVAMAHIEDISDGKATILIPATRVVMGVAMSLTDLDEAPEVERAPTVLSELNDDTPSPAAQEQIAEASEAGLKNQELNSDAVDA